MTCEADLIVLIIGGFPPTFGFEMMLTFSSTYLVHTPPLIPFKIAVSVLGYLGIDCCENVSY